MVNSAKISFKVPKCIAPAKFAVQVKQVRKPAQGDIVWGFVVASAFADVDTSACSLHVAPWLVEGTKRFHVPDFAVPYLTGILWLGGCFVAVPPTGVVVADGHRLVAAPAVHYSKVGEFRHGKVSAAQSIYDDFPVWIDGSNCCDGTPH